MEDSMIEIADRIFYIEGTNRGRYPDCHSMFIKDNTSAIIDPACREDLMRQLASEHGVDIVLNTHYHEDHRIYNYCFDGARLLVHQLDEHGYGSVEHFISGFSVVNSAPLKELWLAFLDDTCKYQPYAVDDTFEDGFEIDLGHTLMQVVHTPGHSAGHCCFFFPREGVAYLGDIDLTSFGPWYASDNSGIDDFLSSIERVRELRPRTVVTSHGDGLITENVDERLKEYADIIHNRDRLILDFLTQPRNLEQILDLEVVYRRNQKAPDAFFYWDDRWMIEEHIKRLVSIGKIAKIGKNYALAQN
jgi:glyoxylase-like metal-dependent hydrolase (beta-lactamase superfamily II)